MAASTTRPYRSELRARQAGETRRRIVVAAAEVFAELGYARTTLKKIAERAGVSPETIQAHGPKAALIRAATELLGLGVEGLDDVTELPDVVAMLDMPPDEMAGTVGPWLLSIHRPLAGITEALVGGAANDPELAEYYRAILESIRANWNRAYDHALERGWVRTDRPREEVVDVWCMAASPETYVRFVRHYGWTDERYATWLTTAYRDIWIGQPSTSG
jgi:AcrR family transcriptional regulator